MSDQQLRTLRRRELAAIDSVATRAAASYARKVFWANKEDLKQEAYIAALEAARRWWDPTCGVPLDAYAWRASVLHLRKWCWRNGAPVHASDHHVDRLRGLHRTSFDTPRGIEQRPLSEVLEDPESVGVEDLLDEKRWTTAVQQQLDYLLTDAARPAMREVAARVIRDAQPPKAVAEELGMPINHVYRLARRARVLLAENFLLFDLWRAR